DRPVAERRGDRGEPRYASSRSVFRHGAGRNVHVDVDLAKIFRICTELPVAAAHETERSLHRFFHYFADVTGQCDVALARITHRLDMQDFPAGWCVSQPSDNTR